MCLLCYHFREVCESHSCFEERVSTFVFSAVRKYTFLRADATLQHFCSGQIESSLVRIRFKGNPQVFCGKSRPLDGDRGDTIECSVLKSQTCFHKYAASQRIGIVDRQVWKQLRPSEKKIPVLSVSKFSFSHSLPHSSSNKAPRVVCYNSVDQRWRNNTSALLHLLHSCLPLPSASPHILSLFPHCDCFLYFITPWHHRSIDVLVLLCHLI